MKLVYANWDRQPDSSRRQVLDTADAYLFDLNALELSSPFAIFALNQVTAE